MQSLFLTCLCIWHHFINSLKKIVSGSGMMQCVKAFSLATQLLSSDDVLVHNDPQLPLTLAADASSYGIGAVISYVLPDKSERPVAFASRTMLRWKKKH